MFFNYNGNGLLDVGEPTLRNVKVVLSDSSGKVVAQTVTDPLGTYDFESITSGNYRLNVQALPAKLVECTRVFITMCRRPG